LAVASKIASVDSTLLCANLAILNFPSAVNTLT
jgi:hypothetical protein